MKLFPKTSSISEKRKVKGLSQISVASQPSITRHQLPGENLQQEKSLKDLRIRLDLMRQNL